MKNPGLNAFAAPVMTEERPSTHPRWGDINDDVDPDRRLDPDEDDSDFMPSASFGRWRNPGQSIKVPVKLGPPYQPGESPHDIIYGELLTKEDQDSADHILNGDHESDHPSANPFVEKARQDLRTPGSDVSVDTLSRLLSGARPQDMGQDAMNAAHAWLSQRFTGVHVNPHHGTLVAQSPAGMQMAVRKQHLPAVVERTPEHTPPAPTYALTNRHGTFESQDPRRLVRTMVAFQVVHNELERKRREREEQQDDQDQNGLAATSGFMHELIGGGLGKRIIRNLRHGVPEFTVPDDAIFEPGRGQDMNEKGQRGGWVSSFGLPGWHRDPESGVHYSPNHSMSEMLDPAKAMKPWPDAYYPGHTYTYMPNPETGHTIERHGRGLTYFVNKLHPAARGKGFDLPISRTPSATPPVPTGNTGALPISSARPPRPRPMPPPQQRRAPRPPTTSAAKGNMNDLCPVCASGYLEPYDDQHHECLNCGSLVSRVGFEHQAAATASRKPARPRGGLGRGLKDIMPYSGDPLNLETGGSENPENMPDPDEVPAEGYVHPLADEVADPDAPVYRAPKALLDKKGGTQEDEELEEHMGKLGFQPIHSRTGRGYIMADPQIEGAYYRLTEGVPTGPDGPRGWALTADHVGRGGGWTQNGDFIQHMPMERRTKDPRMPSTYRHKLPDPGDRPMSDKSILATGTHPIEDDHLNRALRDVAKNGRNSATFQNTFMDAAYEPPRPVRPGPGMDQRALRGLSSVGNPGLTRFVG